MADPVIYLSDEIPADAVVRSVEKDGPHLIGNAKKSGRKCGTFRFQQCSAVLAGNFGQKSVKKILYGRKTSLIFIKNGFIFPNNAEGYCILCAGNGEVWESKREHQNRGWLLIGKRQKRMKKAMQHEDALVERYRRILSAYFFGYWRTSDQNARRMSPFLTECEI